MAEWFDWNTKLSECVDKLDEEITEDQKKLDKFMQMMDGVKDGDRDGDEIINIQFSSEDMDKILKYQDLVKEETVQDAIITAIDIASNAHCEV